MNLKQLFQPRSIAVVGASANPEKIGYQIFKKLLQSKKATIYPVNPKRKKILKKICYPSVLAIPERLDQVIVAVPANQVLSVTQDCVQKKISSLVIISSGFSETGPQGAHWEKKIARLCQNNRILLLGPNCLGYARPEEKLDVTFAKTAPTPGNIGLISQSGAIGSYFFDWAQTENLGFSFFVSLGNRAGISENDCLEYLSDNSETKVIGLYLESFAAGEQFLKIASQLTRKKPVVVLFGGQTQAGQKASQSHTASLSPETDVIATALAQTGSIQAKTLEDLTQLIQVFSCQPKLIDNDLVIITNAGGPSILAADQADRAQFDLTNFSPKILKNLHKSLPPQVQIKNPVDLLGDALAERFRQALTIITQDKTKDAFLIILTPQTMTQPEASAQTIVSAFRSIKKPVIVSVLGGKTLEPARKILQKNNIATIEFPQQAVNLLQTLYHYWHNRDKILPYPVRQSRVRKVPDRQLRRLKAKLQPGLLNWQTIKLIARLYRLPLVETILIKPTNLKTTIRSLGLPVVLKSDPSEAIHRTEKKGLYLNLKSSASVKKALKVLKQKFSVILAQPQLQEGVELFIGLKRHPNFPPLVTVGSGGIYTELYQDIAHAFLPLNKKLSLQLIKQTKIGQIILGARGLPKLDLRSVINLLVSLSQLMFDLPQIQELDINPVIVTETDIRIVDIKINATSLPTRP
jgi:acetyl coenzyme A synthetase (ADP forming)-like protein